MADRVDAVVDATQPPGADPTVDGVSTQPPPEELGACDDAVLGVRQCGDHEVRGG
jgi:hypothetical protein